MSRLARQRYRIHEHVKAVGAAARWNGLSGQGSGDIIIRGGRRGIVGCRDVECDAALTGRLRQADGERERGRARIAFSQRHIVDGQHRRDELRFNCAEIAGQAFATVERSCCSCLIGRGADPIITRVNGGAAGQQRKITSVKCP